MRRAVALLVCCAFALAACGGGARPRATGSSDPTASSPSSPGATGYPTTGGTAGGTPGSKPGSGPTPSIAPTDTYPENVPGMKEAPLEVTLQFGCVRVGTAQRVTVRSEPGLQLAWGTEYSDGTDHQEWGGSEVTMIPPGGVYTKTWVIPPTAPVGETRSDFVVAGKVDGEQAVAMRHLLWQIAKRC